MFNTIILKKGEALLSKREYKAFSKGDTIFGDNSNPEEIRKWNIEQEEEAKEDLAKHVCEYRENIDTWSIKEYALEYCECDEDGDFVEGSDYDLAKEAVQNVD